MARWADVEVAAPELAAATRSLFEAHRHHVLATVRRDGSPRVSGTEVQFRDGDLFIGSMWGARKARDLERDSRFALHTGSDDPPAWRGDAKVSGRMVEIVDADRVREMNGEAVGESHLFRAEISEMSIVRLNEAGDRLVIEAWQDGRPGVQRIER